MRGYRLDRKYGHNQQEYGQNDTCPHKFCIEASWWLPTFSYQSVSEETSTKCYSNSFFVLSFITSYLCYIIIINSYHFFLGSFFSSFGSLSPTNSFRISTLYTSATSPLDIDTSFKIGIGLYSLQLNKKSGLESNKNS